MHPAKPDAGRHPSAASAERARLGTLEELAAFAARFGTRGVLRFTASLSYAFHPLSRRYPQRQSASPLAAVRGSLDRWLADLAAVAARHSGAFIYASGLYGMIGQSGEFLRRGHKRRRSRAADFHDWD